MKLYIDGVLDTLTYSGNRVTGTITDVTNFTIGRGYYKKRIRDLAWQGLIDDVRLYNRPLTQTEITALVSATTTVIMSDDGDGGTDDADTAPKVVFSEIMFASEGGENSLPQWIEMYNNTSREINLSGWKLQWKRLQPSLSEVTTTFQDFIIPPQQSKLLVTALGRHTMASDLSDAAVYQLHVLHAEELGQNDIANRNRLITRGGFSLKLLNPQDALVDHIGTLIDDKQTWQLPECLINGVRSSLIRRFGRGCAAFGFRTPWTEPCC